MRELLRGRRASVRRRGPVLAGALGVLALVAPAGAVRAAEVELAGSWHVLIHYQDAHAHDPEQWRWEDRFWVFEETAAGLRWTEYPIVVFEDPTGRFTSLGTSTASRIPHRWQPNELQRAQIASGLTVDPRGRRSKVLKRQPTGGWVSDSSVRGSSTWRIRGSAELPIFEHEDAGRGGDPTERVTELAARDAPAADVLTGEFERGGSRRGTFRLTRAAPAVGAEAATRDLLALWAVRFGGGLMLRGGPPLGELSRGDARARIRSEIEGDLRGRKLDPADYAPRIDALVEQIERLMLDEGSSWREIGDLLQEEELVP